MPKKRKISEADQAIWNEVSKTISPLTPKVSKPLPDYSEKLSNSKPATKSNFQVEPFQVGSKSISSAIPTQQEIVKRTSPHMDKKNFGRLIKGKKEIDMKVDLHGMTVDQARHHLQSRLFSAQADGLRLILVVTGKGNKTRMDEFNRPQSGILRQSLPQWCQSFPLSKIVLQVVQAQQKHGGSGAYYVYLRRAR